MTFPDTVELAAALRAVPGVADVTVAPAASADRLTAGASAGTVRLSLDAGADEASVVAEANRVLRERFGLGVDSGQVRLIEDAASTDPSSPSRSADPGPAGPTSGQEIDLRELGVASGDAAQFGTTPTALLTRTDRLLIQRMQLVSGRNGVSVAVTLGHDETTHVGESSGAASEAAVHRSVAEATLRAVESVAGERATFALEDVAVVNLGPERVVLTRVLMSAPWGSEKLTGASTVREDVRQAVIRATLDSLNRRIEAIIGA